MLSVVVPLTLNLSDYRGTFSRQSPDRDFLNPDFDSNPAWPRSCRQNRPEPVATAELATSTPDWLEKGTKEDFVIRRQDPNPRR